MPDSAVFAIEGFEFSSFTRVRVTRSLEAIAGSFEVEIVLQKTDGVTDWDRVAQPEDECQVFLRRGSGDPIQTPVLTGYVERRSIEISAREHAVSLAGRDAAAQLVDCSAQPPWSYGSIGVLE